MSGLSAASPPDPPVRVMLVDDSAIIRRLLGHVLDAAPGVEVAGHAANGQLALDALDQIKPDVVILDIEMPVMDGLETLTRLKRRRPDLPVIMFSTLTESGANATLDALTRGADDYVTKPSNTGSFDKTATQIMAVLVPKILGLHAGGRGRRRSPRMLGGPLTTATPAAPAPAAETDSGHATTNRTTSRRAVEHAAIMSQPVRTVPRRPGGPTPEIVVIGVSTGGPSALATLIPHLPGNLPVPVLVTQHMPPIFTRLLAERLDQQSAAAVAEATDGVEARAGQVWFAPGGMHLRVTVQGGRTILRLDDSPPLHSCKPAVDPMFSSAVAAFGGRVLGVILTGMGNDGLDGAREIHGAGGRMFAQDEASSVVWGMPGIVARAGVAEQILPLDKLAGAIVEATLRQPRPRSAATTTPLGLAQTIPPARMTWTR